jgi:predicted lipoprotein with Yx(FWY)xxD motif
MRRSRIIIASAGLAAVAAIGGAPRPGTASARTARAAVAGKTETVAVVTDTHGDQVAYKGHLLYTFTSDSAGQLTGQGFQNFFVATPGPTPLATSPAPATTIPPAPSGGYGH